MNKPITFCLLLGLISAAFAAPPPGYYLVWSDEFNGTTLDTATWTIDTNSEVEQAPYRYYTNGLNLTNEDGAAVLWAKKESYRGFNYTSCSMRTSGKKEFLYGYIEARIKTPHGRGLWPSFWMGGSTGQIALYSQLTGPQLYNGTPGDNCFSVSCNYTNLNRPVYITKQHDYTGCLCDDYHLYAIEWDSLGIGYFFDNNKFFEYDSINQPANFQTFHQPYYFMTWIDIGGAYAGYDIDTTIFPQKMYIDYVRVFQKDPDVIVNSPRHTLQGITLANLSNAQLKLYDLQGRLIADYTNTVRHLKPAQNAMKSIASDLPIGIYVVRLFDGVRTVSEKLAVSR